MVVLVPLENTDLKRPLYSIYLRCVCVCVCVWVLSQGFYVAKVGLELMNFLILLLLLRN